MSKFPNQNISTEKRAKSIDEAIAEALAELGVNEEDVNIEVIQEPAKGFLGLGAKEAVVKVSVKGSDAAAPAEAAEKMTAPVAEAKAEPVHKLHVDAADTAQRRYTSDKPEENAKQFIADVLGAMGLEVKVEARLEDDVIYIELEGEDMGIVIGKRGDTLDSLQYLTSLVVNRGSDNYIKVTIDTENYREKRKEALIALSNRLAAKVAKNGRKFALEPMNPYERRIIHSNLQDNEDVTTFSVGQEPYRKVVIAPKNGGRRGGYRSGRKNRPQGERRPREEKPESTTPSVTYKADFKPQQHKAEYKNFEEYLAAHSKD